MYKNLRQFITALESAGELKRISTFVDPKLEMAEIVDRVSKVNGPALLFENTGTDFPVLINAMGSEKRMCMALGVEHLDETADQIEDLFLDMTAPKTNLMDKIKMLPQLGKIASWMPKEIKGKGACQEVVMDKPDLSKLPVMTCWPHDGGPFITLPVINTKDPNTGIRNVGLYRMQVFEKNLTGMHWHKHKVSAGHFNEYKKLGKLMPVAVALGGDPVNTYCGTAPLPPNVDEYMLSGFLRKKRVELVKCLTQDLYVPADADFIIEGYVDPNEELIWEGPFGDHTGYYSLADWYPKFHVTAITHRKDAVYPSTIVGIPPQEDAWIGKATERIFLAPIRMTMLPEMVDMELPIEGVFHNLTIVKIKKEFAGHGQKVMNAMWGAGQMMFNKILVVCDEGVDIHNYEAVARLLTENVDPTHDILFSQGPMDVLDHSCSKFAFGGKMFIDATTKMTEELRGDSSYNNEADLAEISIDMEHIMGKYPAIQDIGLVLLKKGISIVNISVDKSEKGELKQLSEALFKEPGLNQVKMILFCEPFVDPTDFADVVWRVSNNMDPKRDCFVYDSQLQDGLSHIAIDGTRKTAAIDNFKRDWPNVIAADEATIAAVDEKWASLGLGEFVPSPSLKYATQLYPGGAIAE